MVTVWYKSPIINVCVMQAMYRKHVADVTIPVVSNFGLWYLNFQRHNLGWRLRNSENTSSVKGFTFGGVIPS